MLLDSSTGIHSRHCRQGVPGQTCAHLRDSGQWTWSRGPTWLTVADALLRMKAASFTSCSRCENKGGTAPLHAGTLGPVRLRRPRPVRRRLAISSLTAAGYENVTSTVEGCGVGRSFHQNVFFPNAMSTGIAPRLPSSRRAGLSLVLSTLAHICPAWCAVYDDRLSAPCQHLQ